MDLGDPWSNPSYRRPAPVRNVLRGGRQRLSTLLILGLAIFALVGLATGEYGFRRINELRKKQRTLAAQVAAARERVAKLEFDASDPDRIREREAREGWDMLRPNEMLYEIVRPDSSMPGGAARPTPEAPDEMEGGSGLSFPPPESDGTAGAPTR